MLCLCRLVVTIFGIVQILQFSPSTLLSSSAQFDWVIQVLFDKFRKAKMANYTVNLICFNVSFIGNTRPGNVYPHVKMCLLIFYLKHRVLGFR